MDKFFNIEINGIDSAGVDYSTKVVADEITLNKMLNTYNKEDIRFEEIKQGERSISDETCFCPYCSHLSFEPKKGLNTCKNCKKQFIL